MALAVAVKMSSDTIYRHHRGGTAKTKSFTAIAAVCQDFPGRENGENSQQNYAQDAKFKVIPTKREK